MSTNIRESQNEAKALRLLAAQRRTYGWAKTALISQLVFVVLVPCLLLLAERFHDGFKPLAAFIGLSISILDVAVLEPAKAWLRSKGATAQESFDCLVLDLEWQAIKGPKPDREDLYGAAANTNLNGLRDWYPPNLSLLPFHVARIVCQRSNCWWDSKLRRFYRNAVYGIWGSIVFLVIMVGMTLNLTLSEFVISLMAPVFPVILWALREAKQQGDAAYRADQLKCFGDSIWRKVLLQELTAEQATIRSRIFQDEIYEHRRESPLIFDWFYGMLKNRFESQMVQAAADMVREAQESGLPLLGQ